MDGSIHVSQLLGTCPCCSQSRGVHPPKSIMHNLRIPPISTKFIKSLPIFPQNLLISPCLRSIYAFCLIYCFLLPLFWPWCIYAPCFTCRPTGLLCLKVYAIWMKPWSQVVLEKQLLKIRLRPNLSTEELLWLIIAESLLVYLLILLIRNLCSVGA